LLLAKFATCAPLTIYAKNADFYLRVRIRIILPILESLSLTGAMGGVILGIEHEAEGQIA
jgi:hypothetical protein